MTSDDEILKELQEQTGWLRLLGLQALRPLLTQALVNDSRRVAYELSDGVRSSRDVAKLSGLSRSTLGDLWRDWIAAGICTESRSAAGRAQRMVSLARVGIAVPDLPAGVQAAAASADGEEGVAP